MAKFFFSELSKELISRHGVSQAEAQSFLAAILDSLQEGIDRDGLVKVKGLGTFKLVDVNARESVDVNSGERVVIDSHQKLTFVPDSTMKELVNKPFSQFETVILNEGVDSEMLNRVPEPEEEPVTEEPPVVDPPVEEPAPEPENDPTPEPAVVEEPAPEPAVVEESSPVPADEDEATAEEPKHSYWWAWLLLAIAACVLCFAAGYIYGTSVRADGTEKVTAEEHDAITATAPVIETDTIAATAPVAETDTTVAVTAEKDTVTAPVAEVKPDDEQPAALWQKYDAMDARLRLGAYGIVGTDRVVTVAAGQTLKGITKATLGEGMECYIEVYNGIKAADGLKPGQELKIPKVELKKKLKK